MVLALRRTHAILVVVDVVIVHIPRRVHIERIVRVVGIRSFEKLPFKFISIISYDVEIFNFAGTGRI